MPIIRGIVYDSVGPQLQTLTLSALPPYGVRSAGAMLAKVSGQTTESSVVLGGESIGQYLLSLDGTTLYAGPNYSPTYNRVHLVGFSSAAFNSPFATVYTSAGLASALVPVPGGTPMPPPVTNLVTYLSSPVTYQGANVTYGS